MLGRVVIPLLERKDTVPVKSVTAARARAATAAAAGNDDDAPTSKSRKQGLQVHGYGVELGFAMTVMKMQGQNVARVVADLESSQWTVSALYVACSRVRFGAHLRFLPLSARARKHLLDLTFDDSLVRWWYDKVRGARRRCAPSHTTQIRKTAPKPTAPTKGKRKVTSSRKKRAETTAAAAAAAAAALTPIVTFENVTLNVNLNNAVLGAAARSELQRYRVRVETWGKLLRELRGDEAYVLLQCESVTGVSRTERYCTVELDNVPGDGNCFFRALVKQLQQNVGDAALLVLLPSVNGVANDVNNAHAALRQLVARHIVTYETAPATALIAADALMIVNASDRSLATWSDVQRYIATPGRYSSVVFDQVVLDLASDALDCPVALLQSNSPPQLAGYAPRRRGAPLIIYRAGEHFLSVRRSSVRHELATFM